MIKGFIRRLIGKRDADDKKSPEIPAPKQPARPRPPTPKQSKQPRKGGGKAGGRPKRPQQRSSSRSEYGRSGKESDKWSVDEFQVPPTDGKSRFHDFDLPIPIMHAVYDLGFKYCTPIQQKVLSHHKQGQNIAGRAQTGTGKTAAFLMCVFSRFLAERGGERRKPGTPRALIMAPTRELVLQIAKDAGDLGKYCPFRCAPVFGGMDYAKQERELRGRTIDLIAATPGRLLDFMRRRVVDLQHVETLVIDEADRMLDMGFIPDMRQIIRATLPKNKRRTMLFSATLTDEVLRLASEWMPDPVFCEIDPERVAVDTVEHLVYIVTAGERFRLLYNLLAQKAMTRVLGFGNRRDSTQRLADNLRRHGVRCEYLSGTVRQEKRLRVIEDFREGKIPIVVATDVAGRGLHVDSISHVINYLGKLFR